MMNRKDIVQKFLFAIGFLFVFSGEVSAQTTTISISPKQVIQGEPFFVRIDGVASSSIVKMTFDGVNVGTFMYQGKPSALIGVDLNKKPGAYEIATLLSDGRIIKTSIEVAERKKIEIPLSIPAKLGGDTVASQNKLVSTLASENKSLSVIRTGTKAFWKDAFIEPLKEIFVTDEYGYSRKTGVYTIPHKGTDYRASEGTSIMAMNRGVVRIVKTYRNYGKTIVVDHGLGVMTFYMHLSKMYVNEGELVKRGQEIGLSGKTGYAEAPHLHLGVRINNISIDPVKFMDLFK